MRDTEHSKNVSTGPVFYIAVSPTPLGKRQDACAAIKLSCIGVRGKVGPMEASGLAAFHQRHVDLLQNIGGWVKEDLGFELRYNFYPASGDRPGRVVAAMRVRASASSRDAAVATVQDAARGLLPLLTSLSSSHYWTPVARRDDYREVFSVARLRHSAEIVRQCLRVQVPSEMGNRDADSLSPTPAGAYRGALSKTQLTRLPLIRPFNPRLDTWESLFNTLLGGTAPVVLSVAVAPTRLGEGEAAWLRAAAIRCEEAVWSEPAYGATVVRASAQAAVGQILEAQRVLSDKAFLFCVQLSSVKPLLPGAAEAVGTAISDSADAPEMRSPVHSEARLVRGGFAVKRPSGPEEEAVARRNLARVGFDLWGPSAFPSEARRLERLAGTAEAAAAFRVPAPIPGRFPGLPCETARIVDCQPQAPSADGVLLGLGWSRGRRIPVHVDLDSRRRHWFVTGQTGTGKTTLLHSLAMQDIEAGHGICILDPHGDLAAMVNAEVAARRKDVIYVDLSKEAHGFGLNILEHSDPRVTKMLFEVFECLWDMRACGGPTFEMYFSNSVEIARAGEGTSTLLDVQKVLCDRDFRNARLERCDSVTRSTHDVMAQAGGDLSQANIRPYVLSKLNGLLQDPIMRGIICQEKSTLDFAMAMERRQILLVNLGKGALGQRNSAFLGMLLSIQLLAAALARPRGKEDLADFFVYVDEFQNFTSPSFATMLAEARKFRVNLLLANQHLGQLRPDVAQAVLGNVGGVVAFRSGPVDAEALVSYMAPQFNSSDLMGLPVGRAACSLLMGRAKAEPFTLEVCPVPARPS